MPDWFLEEPDAPLGSDFWFASFFDLSTCRVESGPIPWTAIQVYAERTGLDEENTKALHLIIRQLDGDYLAWIAKERERNKA